MTHQESFVKPPFARAYSFALVTGAFFIFSWVGQCVFQYFAMKDESQQHGETLQPGEFFAQFFASTLENWQSEFLQLIWQAAGLALLLFWGSSQSREGEERMEAKVDRLLEEHGIDTATLQKSEQGHAHA